ncbi:MAG: NAD-dependent epimerase/dehydratase family protein [Candidatus Aenigmarchaeota archaeon]|nr:NAD-dependent epimerase/dehydratase family protein [Candidatus Aenigmarchaeota archaeon]
MKTLITGGSGFIGTNVISKLLKTGNEIAVLDNFPPITGKNLIEFIQADIRNSLQLDKQIADNFDALIHLAAKSDARNMENFSTFKEINVDGTMNVLELARKNDIKKVIFTSSSHVYGNIPQKKFAESGPINPISYYGSSKFFGETICRAYSDFYGINCIILRLFTVYGPGGRTDMAVMRFIDSISQNKPIEVFGQGKIKKDFVYIDDISDGIIKSLNSKAKYEIINLGSGKATDLLSLIAMIENQLGKKARKSFLSMQKGDTAYSCADIKKAKKLLNWSPKVSIEDGIRKTIQWRKSN